MAAKLVPNYGRFDFDRFVNSVMTQGLDLDEMRSAFAAECERAVSSTRGRGGPQARADGAQDYAARLRMVLFWFHHFALANKGEEAAVCQKIALQLIEKGDLKPEALDIFKKPSAA